MSSGSGGKLPDIPCHLAQWQRVNPDSQPPDGSILTALTPTGVKPDLRKRTTYY